MSFTRFRYDKDREDKRLQESSDPGRWTINRPGWGATPSFVEDPSIRLQGWGGNLAANPIAIEDDLRGMTRRVGRDAIDQDYKSYAVKPISAMSAYPADTKLTVGQTRATHPAWMVRGVAADRWETPMYDPQAHTEIPFENMVGSRMEEKDRYSGL